MKEYSLKIGLKKTGRAIGLVALGGIAVALSDPASVGSALELVEIDPSWIPYIVMAVVGIGKFLTNRRKNLG